MKPLVIDQLRTQPGPASGLEFAGEVNGVQFVYDASFSVKSTVGSINAIQAEQLLIISGNDGTSDFDLLRNAELQKVKGIIFLGERSEKLMKLVLGYTHFFSTASSLAEAVQIAKAYAKEKQVVLYSPACHTENGSEAFRELFNS